MRNKIFIIALLFGYTQLVISQEKRNASTQGITQSVNNSNRDSTKLKAHDNHNSTRSNRYTTKDKDTAALKIKASYGSTRSNKQTIKEKDSTHLKNKAQDHNSSRSNKTASIKNTDTINSKPKTTVNTSRSNIKNNK